MRLPTKFEIGMFGVGMAWLGSIAGTWCLNMGRPPVLLVVAARDLPANHKIGTGDLEFTIMAGSRAQNGVERPEEAADACTRIALNQEQPIM
jgi:hypothetical protein